MMKRNKKQLGESLAADDLKWLVSDVVLLDMYKSKLGSDVEYLVLAIKVDDKNPAVDLASFIESGYRDFEDVEVSPATDEDGRYLVFIELLRNEDSYTSVLGILEDASKLSGIDDWRFLTTHMEDPVAFDEESFHRYIITSEEEYKTKHSDSENVEESTDPVVDSISESIKKRIRFLLSY